MTKPDLLLPRTETHALANGITLACRTAGAPGRPLMVFLHGFPEGAFVWDGLLAHFADPAHGGYRCIAPDLRGFGRSSSPSPVEAYKPKELLEDLSLLAQAESADGRIAVLVAHDWGGAFAWAYANRMPERLDRLVILNSPHPATFARELARNPAQRQASGYMNFLARPDAEERLAKDDFAVLFGFLTASHQAGGPPPPWLDEAMRARYRAHWSLGLTGGCNLYRVTPLKPPPSGESAEAATDVPMERARVDVPTLVLWGMRDLALRAEMLDGLDAYVPDLRVVRLPEASHWLVHEMPGRVAAEIEAFVARGQ